MSNDKENVTVPLKYPLKRNDNTLEKLTFRRPKGRDIKRMMNRKKEWDQMSELILATSCDQLTPEEIEELDGSDFVKCSEVLGDFLGT